MSAREESESGRGKRKSAKVVEAPKAIETRERSKKSEKVVDLKLTVSNPRVESKPRATKGSPQQRKRARRVEEETKAAAEPSIPIDQMDSEETHRLIKTFRRVSARAQKQRVVPAKVSYANFLAKFPAGGKKFSIDLRVHTPGTVGYFTSGGVEPGPALVRLARVKGLDMIGLTDFYNASFIDVVQDSVGKTDLTIVPGIDFCCRVGQCKDVQITALFPETYRTAELAAVLGELKIPESVRGRSDYRIETDFAEILGTVERHGGFVIPSQLDKTPYRQLAIPTLVEEFGFRAFDLVYPENLTFFKERWPEGRFVFLSFSNSTALAQIGTRSTTIKLSAPTFGALKELTLRRS